MSWLSWIVFGGLAGWVASLVLRDKQRGCLTNIVTGILGAVLAGFIYQWATGLLLVINLVTRGSRARR